MNTPMQTNSEDNLRKQMDNKEFLMDLLTQNDTVSEIRKNIGQLLSVIPELESMIGFEHCHPHHHLNVWEHTMLALSFSENQFPTRLALLLHDIGKPHCYSQDGEFRHYHGHAEKSAVIAQEILERLGFAKDVTETVTAIVRRHDTPLTQDDIVSSPKFAREIFEVQRCDAMAHNPVYNQKRLTYIAQTKQIIDAL